MASVKKSKYKGRSPNVQRFIASCGSDNDVSSLLSKNLAAGTKLAAKNRTEALDQKTARTYELRLMALEKFAIQNGDDAILFGPNKRPFLAATIQTFLQMMGEVKNKKIGSLRCRGLKPPAIKGHTAAFRYWFEAFGHSGPYSQRVETSGEREVVVASGNPMNASAVKETLKQLVKRAKRPTVKETKKGRVPYEPKKAPPFLLQELTRMRSYCLKTIQGLRGLCLWTITIFSFALFLRGEEPLRLKAKNIKLPANFSAQSGKLPRRVEVHIPWSKADRKAKGIKKGFIFPRVAKDNLKVLAGSARGVTTYRKTFSKMCKELFGKEYTTHSIRRSAARWAARCGADDSTIKRAGRWKSNTFELYTQDARAQMIKDHHDGTTVDDHKTWMFKPLR